MNSVNLPEAPTASPAAQEQSISVALTVGIMTDLDDGRPTLVTATETNLGDLREVSVSEAMQQLRAARAQLDQAEQLINEYAAAVTLPAFIEHYSITVIEGDLDGLADLDPDMAARFRGAGELRKDGRLVVVVPKGQPPVRRLAVIRELVLDLQKQTAQA